MIASILEDVHLLAARGSDPEHGDAVLREAGEDIAVLASAMRIVRRRCSPAKGSESV